MSGVTERPWFRTVAIALLCSCVILSGCKGNSGVGTVLGGLAGAGIGYAVGGGKGALIGGLAGLAIGTLVEHLIRKSSQKAAESGRPAVQEDQEHRVESFPVQKTDDGKNMQVVTVVYDKKTDANGNTYYERAKQDNGQPVPLVEETVPTASTTQGLGDQVAMNNMKVTEEQDVRVTTRRTTDANGVAVTEVKKTSPAGTETFVLADDTAGSGTVGR